MKVETTTRCAAALDQWQVCLEKLLNIIAEHLHSCQRRWTAPGQGGHCCPMCFQISSSKSQVALEDHNCHGNGLQGLYLPRPPLGGQGSTPMTSCISVRFISAIISLGPGASYTPGIGQAVFHVLLASPNATG